MSLWGRHPFGNRPLVNAPHAERSFAMTRKKRFEVRAECPACACGDTSSLSPEQLREKFIGDEKEIEITCPNCGAKHKGEVVEVED